MKARLLGCVLVVFLSLISLVFAKDSRMSLLDIVARMKTELNLSEEQAEAIKPIIKEDILKRQGYFDSIEGDPVTNNAKLRRTMRQFREEMNQELSKVLTPEQMKKLINRQHIRDSLNKDMIDFSEGLSSGVSLGPQGGSMQF